MAIEKDVIFVGNAYSVEYASVVPPTLANTNDLARATPLAPTSAYAELWDITNQEFIELGLLGDNDAGAACTVVENRIKFTLLPTFTQEPGDYKLFITAVYEDGRVVGDVSRLKIQARA